MLAEWMTDWMNEQPRLFLCGLCSSWGSFSSTKVRGPEVRLQGSPGAWLPFPYPEKPGVRRGNWQQREIALRGLLTFPSLLDLLKGSILKHFLRFSHFYVTRVASNYSVVMTCQAWRYPRLGALQLCCPTFGTVGSGRPELKWQDLNTNTVCLF